MGVETEMGTCKNHCYSLDSSTVMFTELYKPSHWYAIVVSIAQGKLLRKTVYGLTSFVIYYNYTRPIFNTLQKSTL